MAGNPTMPPAAQQVTVNSPVTPQFLQQLRFALVQGIPQTVVIDQPTALIPLTTVQQKQWRPEIKGFPNSSLTVVITRPVSTGSGGALLYALARQRIVLVGTTADQLPAAVEQPLSMDPAVCDQVCHALITAPIHYTGATVPATAGSPVIISGPPTVAPTARPSSKAASNPASTAPAAPGHGPGVATWLLVALALIAMLIVLWLARTRAGSRHLHSRTGPASTSTQLRGPILTTTDHGADARSERMPPGVADQPDGPRVTLQEDERTPGVPPPPTKLPPLTGGRGPDRAIVRTELAPQGYVELDGWLCRVTWDGPGPAPERGRDVAVFVGEQGGLIARIAAQPG